MAKISFKVKLYGGPRRDAVPFASFPVRSGSSVRVYIATREDAEGIGNELEAWKAAVKRESNPKKLDAAELGVLAVRRWREGSAKGRVAESIVDLQDRIQDNPYSESSLLLIARAEDPSVKGILGLAHLRRTWCNHLFLDYLAVSPALVGNAQHPYAGGLGTGLLYQVVEVGRQIKVPVIWGETTQNSVKYYSKLFKRKMKDLLYLTEPVYLAFQEDIRRIWATAKEEKA